MHDGTWSRNPSSTEAAEAESVAAATAKAASLEDQIKAAAAYQEANPRGPKEIPYKALPAIPPPPSKGDPNLLAAGKGVLLYTDGTVVEPEAIAYLEERGQDPNDASTTWKKPPPWPPSKLMTAEQAQVLRAEWGHRFNIRPDEEIVIGRVCPQVPTVEQIPNDSATGSHVIAKAVSPNQWS